MGLITKIFAWGNQGTNSNQTRTIDWFAFLVLVLIASFLWTRVVHQTID
jgi:hypothetical protein